jgi:hypothetical protein
MLKAELLVAAAGVPVPAAELAAVELVLSESHPLKLSVTQVTKSTAMKSFVVDAMATIP